MLALPVTALLENGRDKVQLSKVVDGYVVDLSFPATPRRADDNPVFVTLSTADGEPAAGATVSVSATPRTGEGGHGDGAEAGAHGDAAEAHDAGDAMDMGGNNDHENMEMGESGDDMNMDMGESGDHENMDMGGKSDHEDMDMGEPRREMNMDTGGEHDPAETQKPRRPNVPTSPRTVLRPDRTTGVHKGLISIRSGDAAKMDVKFALAGTEHVASFDVDIERQRPRALVFGGFAAANFLVLIAAFFIRRRERAARRRRFA